MRSYSGTARRAAQKGGPTPRCLAWHAGAGRIRRIPHDRTLKALVDCLQEMGVEFLMDDAGVGVGIRVRHPKLHREILAARDQTSA